MNPVHAQQMESPAQRGNGSQSLTVGDFKCIASSGFGDPRNSYPHSMAWYQDHLYVGTTRNILHVVKLAPDPKFGAYHLWPVDVPAGTDAASLDQRCQIWRYSPRENRWQKVSESPLVWSNGVRVWRDFGYRSMVVAQTQGDTKPALYVSTTTSSKAPGAIILRSTDGLTFAPVTARGMGNLDVSSFRALVGFNRRLYTSPSGKGRQWAFTGSPVVLESSNPAAGQWRPVSVPGFGDDTNQVIFEMAVFNGHLYAGTGNPANGYQVWKTRAEGSVPYAWKKVITNGAYRGNLNQAVMSMFVFKNALYVGGGIRRGGYDREFNTGPAAAELIRIHPDGSWDLVAGDERRTPDGLKSPLSKTGPGFGNPFTGYIWSMAEYDGFLYVGTYDSTVLLSFMDAQKLSPAQRGRLNSSHLEQIVEIEGGFDLWSSSDGVRWEQITHNGFGNKYNYGVRTLVGAPYGLFLGAANPFAPDVATKTSAGWCYLPNPRGGLEVWMGSHANRVEGTAQSLRGSPQDLYGAINRRYDRTMYEPFFSKQADFANFGYWEPGVHSQQRASENLMQKLLDFLPEKKGTILDVACGKGATTRHLLKYYPPTQVTGINISQKQLETCRSNAPGCRFLQMSATDLNFEDDSFDSIICVEAAFHFNTREEFLRQALRVLKPGGRLVLSDILISKPTQGRNPLYPKANSIENAAAYAQLFSRVGFDTVEVVDATEECWRRFCRHFLPYAGIEFAAGRLDFGTYKRLQAWIWSGIVGIRSYVLACARKPPTPQG